MNRTALIGAALMLAAPAAAMAASPFDGTWKTDPSTMSWSGKPTVYSLRDGVFACESCVPPQKIKADGSPHPYVGNPYIDSMTVNAVNDHTVRSVGLKGGRQRGVQTIAASPDGKTMTVSFAGEPLNPGASPVSYSRTYTRIGAASAGANAITGSWRRTAETAMSPNTGVNVFKVNGDSVDWSSPSGISYAVNTDGKPAPIKGDPGADHVTLQKTGARAMTETDWKDGKKVDVIVYRISVDGQTMTVIDTDTETGLVTTAKAKKK